MTLPVSINNLVHYIYDNFAGITVQFTQSTYSTSEISRQIVIGLQLDGGSFVSPSIVNVTVTAIPITAMG